MKIVVAKLGILAVNRSERPNHLTNHIRHHIVCDPTAHFTHPAFQGSTMCVLCVHDHLLLVIEDAWTSARIRGDWDEELLVEKLDWFRDVSRGNLIKSLLDVVFDASRLVCSRVRLVRR